MPRPASSTKLDLDALHRILWRLSDGRRHQLCVNLGDLADELGVTKPTMSRCMTKLRNDGRIRSLGHNGMRTLHVITQPADME